MKDSKGFVMVLLLSVAMLTGFLFKRETNRHMEECKRIEASSPVEVIIHDTLFVQTDFPNLVRTLIDIESKGNPNAVNSKSGAAGILQLMPIYVREANRILGENVYTLEDRFDPVKTLEMFCIIQDYHNPEQDIDKAIRLHNKGKAYYRLVKTNL